jgi:transposase InsO family protein
VRCGLSRIAAQPRPPIAHIAHEMGISRTTAYRWWGRYQQARPGRPGRPAQRPRPPPQADPARLEQRILRLRRRERLGPARIAARVQLPASTVHRVLVRHQMNRLASWIGQPAGRSAATSTSIPATWSSGHQEAGPHPRRGGHRVHGRAGWDAPPSRQPIKRRLRRAACRGRRPLPPGLVEILSDERAQTCARFWRRAHHWFALHGLSVVRVLSDNRVGYRSRLLGAALADTGLRHQRTRPYRPRTNGKVERFNRTLLEEWAYRRLYPHMPPVTKPCRPGSTPTTITVPTPLSEACHRSPNQQPPGFLHLDDPTDPSGSVWIDEARYPT